MRATALVLILILFLVVSDPALAQALSMAVTGSMTLPRLGIPATSFFEWAKILLGLLLAVAGVASIRRS